MIMIDPFSSGITEPGKYPHFDDRGVCVPVFQGHPPFGILWHEMPHFPPARRSVKKKFQRRYV